MSCTTLTKNSPLGTNRRVDWVHMIKSGIMILTPSNIVTVSQAEGVSDLPFKTKISTQAPQGGQGQPVAHREPVGFHKVIL